MSHVGGEFAEFANFPAKQISHVPLEYKFVGPVMVPLPKSVLMYVSRAAPEEVV